jgi:hypothetical protein
MHGGEHQSADPIAHIFKAWDAALGAKDLDASMALYHLDATLESPLVRHLPGTGEGQAVLCQRGDRSFCMKTRWYPSTGRRAVSR